MQEAEWTRLSVAMERVEAAHHPHGTPEQRGSDGSAIKALNKQLTAVAAEVPHTTRARSFPLALTTFLTSLHTLRRLT